MSGDEQKRSESTKSESEKMPVAESKRNGIEIIAMIGIVTMIEIAMAETTEMIETMTEIAVEETATTNSTAVRVRSEVT